MQSVRRTSLIAVTSEEGANNEVVDGTGERLVLQVKRLDTPEDGELVSEMNAEIAELTKTRKTKFYHPSGSHDDRLRALASQFAVQVRGFAHWPFKTCLLTRSHQMSFVTEERTHSQCKDALFGIMLCESKLVRKNRYV